ncbi:S-adenosyl-L-methionine-dependent methyltransferase [Stipitochalara longipes BDJ]|nr:S-adenosyl-L-methionine-dependent methyltransferase [Stipitochalara longipes BDJ]
MSLYWETAELLTAPANAGGSLKARIFGKKDLKSQPAQVYALAIETCKWSSILKEVVENADILRVERKLTPILSILLAHDLLLAKKGVALPATHGLRVAIERHKNRLQAEFTRARIRRKLGSTEAFKAFVESGLEDGEDGSERLHPRWIRVNTLKTTLEDQLDTTFSGYERSTIIGDVRHRGSKRLFIDFHVPNLIAISPNIDLSKSEAYKTGAIIFQDKASCFPAYLLDPLAEDGDIIDTCAAPGNKTTHIAAILLSHNSEPDECSQAIHAFEKNKGRAETLQKMVILAGTDTWTKLHPGKDFLKTDPESAVFKNVGALLLDPSCSGSGIIGRDDMPELHLPAIKQASSNTSKPQRKGSKVSEPMSETRKRKREHHDDGLDVMVDDDGEVTAINSEDELKARIEALSKFQLELLLHAFKFPSARKITYSTCSIHTGENELVVQKALEHPIAKERGWRILKRENQVRGMQEWPVRGSMEACYGNEVLAEACIRANKDDEHCTMGFFLAGFTRDLAPKEDMEADFLRDERGHLVRDIMGFPVRVNPQERSFNTMNEDVDTTSINLTLVDEGEEEWSGFGDDLEQDNSAPLSQEIPKNDKNSGAGSRHDTSRKRPQFGITNQKRKKSKKSS